MSGFRTGPDRVCPGPDTLMARPGLCIGPGLRQVDQLPGGFLESVLSYGLDLHLRPALTETTSISPFDPFARHLDVITRAVARTNVNPVPPLGDGDPIFMRGNSGAEASLWVLLLSCTTERSATTRRCWISDEPGQRKMCSDGGDLNK